MPEMRSSGLGRALRALALLGVIAGCGQADLEDEEPEPDPSPGSGGAQAGGGGRGGTAGAAGAGGAGEAGAAGGRGGTPAADAGAADTGADPAPPPPPVLAGGSFPRLPDTANVIISEVMYHPVKEEADEDFHEFVEIYNRGAAAVSLRGWKLEATGGMTFTFPDDARIEPKQYRVIAKDPKKLAAVYGLMEATLLGPYKGELDNGGATVALKNAAGATVDSLRYDDKAPWPISADALGVKEDWLPRADQPILKHQYRGRSLERISVDGVTNHPANWEASPLDGATPGKVNASTGEPQPLVEAAAVAPEGGSGLVIKKTERAQVKARFSNFGKVENVQIEFFDDDPQRTDEAPARMPMTWNAGEMVWQYTFPAKPDNTIVRYRIHATLGGKAVRVYPRVTDPMAWKAFFVTPESRSTSRTYHMFISAADWTRLEENIARSRESGCEINPNWQKSVPATFVHDGRVYDVFVRYNGSRYQRRNGGDIRTWTVPGPRLPVGKQYLKALSWKVRFPRYDTFGGYADINLNKQWQGCPGTVAWVENALLEKGGLPAQKVRFVRLNINTAYYHYMAELERIDEELVRRYLKPGEPMGEIFKDDGAGGNAAAHARGDFRPIAHDPNYCNGKWTLDQRYEATYPRVNFDHRGPAEIKKLILDLDAAKRAGPDAVRAYFQRHWDVDALLTSYAIRNWTGVWDDTFHNYYPVKRADGKWTLIQQDFEWTFGLGGSPELRNGEYGLAPWNANVTFYIGVRYEDRIVRQCEIEPAGSAWMTGWRVGNCNALGFFELKDQLIRTHRQQFDDKLRALSKTILAPENVNRVIDEAVKEFNLNDWNEAPAVKACSPQRQHEVMKTWVRDRHRVLVERLKP